MRESFRVSWIQIEVLPMNLLLAATLLLQDKTAEETYKKIEEKIVKATSLSMCSIIL